MVLARIYSVTDNNVVGNTIIRETMLEIESRNRSKFEKKSVEFAVYRNEFENIVCSVTTTYGRVP